MRKHRAIIEPKFEQVETILESRLGDHAVATWTRPEGGYFISLDVPDGCAPGWSRWPRRPASR